jgi:hypothetical protein
LHQYLNLTEDERKWCDYYDDGTKRGVLSRRRSGSMRLEGGVLEAPITFSAPRYSRVWGVTFSGDVAALRVLVSLGTGERITQGPLHVPLLCGGTCHSTLLQHPAFYNPDYPSQGLVGENVVPQPSRPWVWICDPNLIVPNNQSLLFNFSLENVDAGIPEGGFFGCELVIHHYQLPGYEGGP